MTLPRKAPSASSPSPHSSGWLRLRLAVFFFFGFGRSLLVRLARGMRPCSRGDAALLLFQGIVVVSRNRQRPRKPSRTAVTNVPTSVGFGHTGGQGASSRNEITNSRCRRRSRRSFSGKRNCLTATSLALGGTVRTHHAGTSRAVPKDGFASVPRPSTRSSHLDERIT